MILLQDGTQLIALVGGLCSIGGGAVVWSLNWFMNFRKVKRGERKEDEDTAISRYEKLLQRVDTDREHCERQLERVEDRLSKAERRAERAVACIMHFQTALDNAHIPYRKWSEDGGPEGIDNGP